MGVQWKCGAIVSIETRSGLYALAQMLSSPYMMFFDRFHTKDDFKGVELKESEAMFCVAVTRQFLSQSLISKQKIAPVAFESLPTQWIDSHNDAFYATVWENTPSERKVGVFGPGGRLVYKDTKAVGMINNKVIMPDIPFDDDATINAHELTNLELFPSLNERLYLCHLFGRNINPLRDISFLRELPSECERYVDLLNWPMPPKDEIRWEDYSLTLEEAKHGKRLKK